MLVNWGPFGEVFLKSLSMPKKLNGATFSLARNCILREKKKKPFWFSSLGQQVQFGALKFCRIFGRTVLVTSSVSKNKTGTSQVGAISKAQKYSRNNLETFGFFSNKVFLEKNNFFSKVFLKKSHNAEILKKRPFRFIKRFYKPKTSKKCKGVPFDRIRKFSKKNRIVPKKTQRGPLVWPLLLEA